MLMKPGTKRSSGLGPWSHEGQFKNPDWRCGGACKGRRVSTENHRKMRASGVGELSAWKFNALNFRVAWCGRNNKAKRLRLSQLRRERLLSCVAMRFNALNSALCRRRARGYRGSFNALNLRTGVPEVCLVLRRELTTGAPLVLRFGSMH